MIYRNIIKIDNFLTDDKISLINKELLKLDPLLEDENHTGHDSNYNKLSVASFTRVYMDDFYDTDRTKSDTLKIFQSQIFSQSVYDKIPKFELLLKLIPSSNHHECQYTVYNKGGEFKWHVDSNSTPKAHRLANFIYYLNDDFEGGKLELSFRTDIDSALTDHVCDLSVDLVVTPKKNTLIIMPSDMWHRVKPVTKGKRRTVNGHIGFLTESS